MSPIDLNFSTRPICWFLCFAVASCQVSELEWKGSDSVLAGRSEISLNVQYHDELAAKFNEPWSRGKAAAIGAAGGASLGASCLGEIDPGGGGGAEAVIGGIAILFCLGVTAVGSAIGAVAGAATTDAADEIESATRNMQAVLVESEPSEEFRDVLVAMLQENDIAVVPNTHSDHRLILNIEIKEFDLAVTRASEGLFIFSIVQTISDGDLNRIGPFQSYSIFMEPIDYTLLGRDGARELKSMINRAYQVAAEKIVAKF